MPNHLISSDPTDFPETAGPEVVGAGDARAARTRPVRLECIARGYLFGSAWSEYEERGHGLGRACRPGCGRPSGSRADLHADHEGRVRARPAAHRRRGGRRWSATTSSSGCARPTLPVYELGAAHAESCGIILADTKFEFGAIDDELLVIDEMLTPDSSRYWPAEDYRVGMSPPSFDKQYVRDHYLTTRLGPDAAGAAAAPEVIDGTRARYVEAYELLTGESFDEWYGADE